MSQQKNDSNHQEDVQNQQNIQNIGIQPHGFNNQSQNHSVNQLIKKNKQKEEPLQNQDNSWRQKVQQNQKNSLRQKVQQNQQNSLKQNLQNKQKSSQRQQIQENQQSNWRENIQQNQQSNWREKIQQQSNWREKIQQNQQNMKLKESLQSTINKQIQVQQQSQKKSQYFQNLQKTEQKEHLGDWRQNLLNEKQNQKPIQVSISQEFQNIQLSQSNDTCEILQASKLSNTFQEKKQELNNTVNLQKIQNFNASKQKLQQEKDQKAENIEEIQIKNQLSKQQNQASDDGQKFENKNQYNKVEMSSFQNQAKPMIQPEIKEQKINQSALKKQPIDFKHFENKINEAISFKTEGNTHFKNNNYQEAIKNYSQGLRILDPKHFYGATAVQLNKMAELSANLLLNIGSCFFNLNIWRNAQIYFSEAITINPNYTKAIYKRALCRYQLQNYESAMDDIKTAFAQDKSNKEIYASYQKILIKYNEQLKKDKENLKEMSSKIFRSDSQKSLNSKSQKDQKVNSSQISQKQGQKQMNKINQDEGPSQLWSLAPIALIIGVGLFWGYKKLFGKP